MKDSLPSSSPYMRWAKLESGSTRFNLATSGVEAFPLSELPAQIGDLEINGPGRYGFPPLQECLAHKTGASIDCIIPSIGTSMANFVALSALVRRGDEVLLEQPTYHPLREILEFLGAKLKRFERSPENNFAVDLEALAAAITPATRLIVLANLHNPSSALVPDEEMRRIGELAANVGATVFVDEVYLETLFDRPWRSSFFLGRNFVVTSSLTKAYGLSGLRCGWILAPENVKARIWQVIDMTYGIPAHPAERLSAIALDHLPQIAARARHLVETNRVLLNQFLAGHRDRLDCPPSFLGTTVAPRLRAGSAATFCENLRENFETTVVPGDFFELPDCFRIGIGGPTENLENGLEQISRALATR